MFNEKTCVASTRLSSSSVSSGSSFSSTSSGSSLDSSSTGGVPSSSSGRDVIWDDSFTFDSLPLDVSEARLCLFCIASKTSSSASSVLNNLRRLGAAASSANSTVSNATSAANITAAFNSSHSKMIEPCLLGTFMLFLYLNFKELLNDSEISFF